MKRATGSSSQASVLRQQQDRGRREHLGLASDLKGSRSIHRRGLARVGVAGSDGDRRPARRLDRKDSAEYAIVRKIIDTAL
jgi:hypothetical protein